jgi:hypothetical protein
MPTKKKNAKKIKQTRKQKKKSELKKKVRKVIRKKYTDDSDEEVLYQAEREQVDSDSSSESGSESRRKKPDSYESYYTSSDDDYDSESSRSRHRRTSSDKYRGKRRSRRREDSEESSRSKDNSEDTREKSGRREKSRRDDSEEKKHLDEKEEKREPEDSMVRDRANVEEWVDELTNPARVARIQDVVPLDAPKEITPPRSPPKSPVEAENKPEPKTPPRSPPRTPPKSPVAQLPPPPEPKTPPRSPPRTPPSSPPAPPAPLTQQPQPKEIDDTLLHSKFQYVYDTEEDVEPAEYFSSKKVEEFILGKGFMILEYFVVHDLCAFILIQLPAICETMMVYVNRKKFPIKVSDSSYKKTALEKLKIEKCEDDTYDYENMTLNGFDLSHTLDTIKETNQQQKSLAYYVYRQISRMMYVTKNIEIKPCILLHNIFGFYEVYHIPDRKPSKEFYPVISLETLFSKTFLLEQNIPVFYQRFYSIMNQSNRNKMEYLESSLNEILKKMDSLRVEVKSLQTKDTDKQRVKTIVDRLDKRTEEIAREKTSILETVADRVAQSYQIKRLDEQHSQIDLKKAECNALYSEIKREYDKHVFQHELMFHELYYKIRDMEALLKYLE